MARLLPLLARLLLVLAAVPLATGSSALRRAGVPEGPESRERPDPPPKALPPKCNRAEDCPHTLPICDADHRCVVGTFPTEMKEFFPGYVGSYWNYHGRSVPLANRRRR